MNSNIKLCLLVVLLPGMIQLAGCGSEDTGPTGTLRFTANGEDFVREGFVSEDQWNIQFEAVYVNVFGPTAWQAVLDDRQLTPLHGGHPHGSIPDGTAHVALTGEYFLSLKQPAFEIGLVEQAPIGNYNQLNFTIRPATNDAHGFVPEYLSNSIVMIGQATRAEQTIDFTIQFSEELHWESCGPNADAGILAKNGQAEAQMTFHFDHIFGDALEGPADTRDENTVNYVAIGFGPFASLAQDGSLDLDQADLQTNLEPAVFDKIMTAIKTLGHSGEGHCHLVE